MKLSLCNEVIRELEFSRQCDFARKAGYDGLELAPFTLGDNPHFTSATERTRLRRAASEAGIEITSLHWLLVTPKGLSITSPDTTLRTQTIDVMRRLVALCADLGGKALVHGSPQQRNLAQNDDRHEAWKRACECFAAAAAEAQSAGLVYCIEPLSTRDTNFINSVAEAFECVKAVNNPALQTMIDCCAAGSSEELPIPQLIDRWLPTGIIAHFHANDPNRRGPGQGDLAFTSILAALKRHSYSGVVGVEPFDYVPDGPGSAARAIGYLRGILEK
ncbi:MAG: sugar phosphate isomerase/epimerase [Acidobacteriales bacterium]|nr:sugar phosphate isomerase/epimerase [Terriglobales bacterium]MCI0422634.1 sugar phosphate isomerase/epimerase [Acidobacteriota bacterium]MCI0620254.1 sugar phosphate isomerase/epimerase [Acidobacteriota bacterium]MCI0722959.1 sugar phosphate isomerase/epimerase [Acidobacteriota bacterium]